MPMENISVSFASTTGSSPKTVIRADDRYSVYVRDLVTCNDKNALNRLTLSADFVGSTSAYLEISNPVFEFCASWNCPIVTSVIKD